MDASASQKAQLQGLPANLMRSAVAVLAWGVTTATGVPEPLADLKQNIVLPITANAVE
jgi:hypothetical protein